MVRILKIWSVPIVWIVGPIMGLPELSAMDAVTEKFIAHWHYADAANLKKNTSSADHESMKGIEFRDLLRPRLLGRPAVEAGVAGALTFGSSAPSKGWPS